MLAFVVLFVLRDKPGDATWLAEDERAWLASPIAVERAKMPVARNGGWRVVRNPVIVARAYFGINLLIFCLSFFLPQIVREFHLSLKMVGVVAAISFFIAGFGMMWWGRRSDRHNERRFHVILPMALAVIGSAARRLLRSRRSSSCACVSPRSARSRRSSSSGRRCRFCWVRRSRPSRAIGIVKDATGSIDVGIRLIAL